MEEEESSFLSKLFWGLIAYKIITKPFKNQFDEIYWEEKINLILNKYENFQLDIDKLKKFNKKYEISVFNMLIEEQLKENL